MTDRGSWNFADVWETIASVLPEAPALIYGDQTTSQEFTSVRMGWQESFELRTVRARQGRELSP